MKPFRKQEMGGDCVLISHHDPGIGIPIVKEKMLRKMKKHFERVFEFKDCLRNNTTGGAAARGGGAAMPPSLGVLCQKA